MKFFIKDFFSKWPNPQETADWVTFTEETLIGKLHFLSSGKLQGRWESNVHLMNSIDQSIPESCSYQTVIHIHEEDVKQKKDLKIPTKQSIYEKFTGITVPFTS